EFTELLTELLSLEGFKMKVVHNGLEGLNELESNQYDLVLLDVMMPVLSGVKTLKRIRQKYSLPVLMLSARDDQIDRILGLELGADDYVPKPFNNRELVARMKAILRRTTSRPASTDHSEQNYTENISKSLQFAGVELHSGRQQAYYQGCDLDLTGTEFALLQMLMRNSGEILSRELLSLKILGKNLTPYDRAIDMHISNLRKKLPEREDGLPWFKTLRGRGYL
ncbi:TPA: response regulator, partial [Mannheimia haemolytica]|nr:response regulator [Mannheimia haemolytica]HDL5498177.1 response regulator [Mannheimia haemolytica]HDL5793629.1 response regulator [Mannheimia haemolytica]HDL5911281.1 response regulator [Mannheimia haemolytica]HDL6031884.1 response regulator [Mannheimia haemolytica]